MNDFVLPLPRGAKTARKTRGRGSGSGKGGTCGKGTKGQKARSGPGIRPGFEGGQMPLFRRLPRRGFSNHPFKKRFQVLNVSELDRKFADGEVVTPDLLAERGLIRSCALPVKVLGDGSLHKKLTVKAFVSASARRKIEEAGGAVEPGDGAEQQTPKARIRDSSEREPPASKAKQSAAPQAETADAETAGEQAGGDDAGNGSDGD